MLAKINRLPHSPLVEVLKRGKRVCLAQTMDLLYVRSKTNDIQWAFIVPLATSKHATVRNRIKRILRKGVQHALDHIVPSTHAVIIGKRGLAKINQHEAEEALVRLLKTAKLLI